MKLRYARHSNDLSKLISFYTEIIGMEVLGNFKDHDSYDGVFLGFKNCDWHLEFTSSDTKALHHPDPDDLLIFYLSSAYEVNQILKKAVDNGSIEVVPKNPYWIINGKQINDPDGYGIVLALKDITLSSKDNITSLIQSKNIHSWSTLIDHVQNLPYGRNTTRDTFELVISEGKGTCSSKHALLKKVADHNNINIKLFIGIYKMNTHNTPGIGSHLEDNGLAYLPEAHCYVKSSNGQVMDMTSIDSSYDRIKNDLLKEIEITPDQVTDYKVEFHKTFIKQWASENKFNIKFDKIWAIREACIDELSKSIK